MFSINQNESKDEDKIEKKNSSCQNQLITKDLNEEESENVKKVPSLCY